MYSLGYRSQCNYDSAGECVLKRKKEVEKNVKQQQQQEKTTIEIDNLHRLKMVLADTFLLNINIFSEN